MLGAPSSVLAPSSDHPSGIQRINYLTVLASVVSKIPTVPKFSSHDDNMKHA